MSATPQPDPVSQFEPVIKTVDLQMVYGENHVLAGIDIEIARGEVVVLLGPNGAGKTTTVEILEGFRQPSSGQVRVLGADPATAGDAWRARVGIVLQSWRDHAKWRVRELLDYLGGFYAPYSGQIVRPWPTDELLGVVGLADQANTQVAKLSGGRRRRLDVAVGLVGRPELLFLDEPTAGFDPQARRDFHDLLASLADLDTTILMTTHDLDEAEKVASRILVLADGKIVAHGSPDALRRTQFGKAEVRWFDGTTHQVHASDDPVEFLRSLLTDPAAQISDLEVRRNSLEDVYLALTARMANPERKADR